MTTTTPKTTDDTVTHPDDTFPVGYTVAILIVPVAIIVVVILYFIVERKWTQRQLAAKARAMEEKQHIEGMELPRIVVQTEEAPVKSSQKTPTQEPVGKPIFVRNLRLYIAGMENIPDAFVDEFNSLEDAQQLNISDKSQLALDSGNGPSDNCDSTKCVSLGDGSANHLSSTLIEGYNAEKRYLATQTPTRAIIGAFWRFVWEEQCSQIVMLSTDIMNVCTNNENTHSEEVYWPAVQETMVHGDVEVRLEKEELWPCYTLRTFQLSQGVLQRTVAQYVFSSWTDNDCPSAIDGFLRFIKCVNDENISYFPIIVHCTNGVGPTGVFISMDICIDQIEAEGIIDLYACLWHLREKRKYFVQNADQYRSIYRSLLEYIAISDEAASIHTRSSINKTYL